MIRTLAAALLVCSAAIGQHKVDSGNIYKRIIAVVPLTGAGTPKDPKRSQETAVFSMASLASKGKD
jgi:hypothetical protein